MKARNLLNKAKKELKDDREKVVVGMLKASMKRIEDCKKTLRLLENNHKQLLSSNIEDLELDEYEY